jgi:hypothetical protein
MVYRVGLDGCVKSRPPPPPATFKRVAEGNVREMRNVTRLQVWVRQHIVCVKCVGVFAYVLYGSMHTCLCTYMCVYVCIYVRMHIYKWPV